MFNRPYFIIFLFIPILVNSQTITTVAGNGIKGNTGFGGPALAASIGYVGGITLDPVGNLYVTSTDLMTYNVVLKVDTLGVVYRFAGSDSIGFGGDGGPATAAKFHFPLNIVSDYSGNIYISDLYMNHRIRKVDLAGIITTFAGNGSDTVSGDGGPATAAGLGSGNGICFDRQGNLYIAAGSRIRKVDNAGIISTFAGTGVIGFGGDGGPATAAMLHTPSQITFDIYGNMYIADDDNHRIRKIDVNGIITTFAGTGLAGFSGDGGAATAAQINSADGVFADKCDNVFIADDVNHRLRIVNGSGMIKTFAGSGIPGFSGDGGPAIAAKLFHPNFICLDDNSNIYFGDAHNFRVRYIHMDSCRNTTEVPVSEVASAGLTVVPNPSSGTCTIRLSSLVDEPVAVVVTDVVGTVIKYVTATTNRDSELMLHTPGLYLITATTATGKWTQKILVQ